MRQLIKFTLVGTGDTIAGKGGKFCHDLEIHWMVTGCGIVALISFRHFYIYQYLEFTFDIIFKFVLSAFIILLSCYFLDAWFGLVSVIKTSYDFI